LQNKVLFFLSIVFLATSELRTQHNTTSSPLYSSLFRAGKKELACLVTHWLTICMSSLLSLRTGTGTPHSLSSLASFTIARAWLWGSSGVFHFFLYPTCESQSFLGHDSPVAFLRDCLAFVQFMAVAKRNITSMY
jgi:ABC-type glycerol-3-phosphate transport system permease component